MKLFLIFIGTIFTYVECASKLEHIDVVGGAIDMVNFDEEGNTYIASSFIRKKHEESVYKSSKVNVDHRLFILNPSRQLISTVDLPPPIDEVVGLVITSYGDVYLVFQYWGNPAVKRTFAVVKSGSQTAEIIEDISSSPNTLFFLDDNDNLIYARKSGIHVLKPNSTVPVPVKNLENYVVFELPQYRVEDGLGNVYREMLRPNRWWLY